MQSSAAQLCGVFSVFFFFFFFTPANDRSEILPQSDIKAGREPEEHPPPPATHAQKRKH